MDIRVNSVNKDGRYPCRIPGCQSTFPVDGESRRKHELKHNPPGTLPEEQIQLYFSDPQEEQDDMYSCQKALLECWWKI